MWDITDFICFNEVKSNAKVGKIYETNDYVGTQHDRNLMGVSKTRNFQRRLTTQPFLFDNNVICLCSIIFLPFCLSMLLPIRPFNSTQFLPSLICP
jgi:hypothetical protein